MRVLITGAAGFIGSHLTEACLERRWKVTAIDSLTTYYSPTDKVRNAERFSRYSDCLYLEQDLLDVDLDLLVRDVQVVFHLAGQAGVRASWGQGFDAYTQLNVTALQRVLEAARGARELTKFVFASSSSVYGDAETLPTSEDQILRPISPYGATKALGEHLCYLYFRAFGLPTVALRFFSVYGPRQRPDMGFHRLIEAGLSGSSFPLYGDGEQTRDFTYVDDIVDGTLASVSDAKPGSVLNLGGGARISMNEVIDLVRAEFSDLKIERLDTGRGDARDTGADIGRAREMIGFDPKITVPDGIKHQIEWHRERHNRLRGT
jgi:nucleoside-diphosphate-sugar epimerase